MAKFTKQAVVAKIVDKPIVPLFTSNDLTITKSVLKACYDGGVRVFEYTNRSTNSRQIFIELLKYVRTEMSDMTIGIGTIFNAEEAQFFIENDADFIIQPIVNKEVGKLCFEKEIAWIPGAMTMTEIYQSIEGGAEIVKIFPANTLGPSFIKAIRGPLPNVKLMATGGVLPTVESLNEWFSAGVTCVGIGSQLCPAEIIETGDYEQLQRNVERCIAFVNQFNKQKNDTYFLSLRMKNF
jgi:2-dehydro-3-deoxyphosphogluconate aldolase / (4S)-4-hydroxy-2-oxoglutarate aldolase